MASNPSGGTFRSRSFSSFASPKSKSLMSPRTLKPMSTIKTGKKCEDVSKQERGEGPINQSQVIIIHVICTHFRVLNRGTRYSCVANAAAPALRQSSLAADPSKFDQDWQRRAQRIPIFPDTFSLSAATPTAFRSRSASNDPARARTRACRAPQRPRAIAQCSSARCASRTRPRTPSRLVKKEKETKQRQRRVKLCECRTHYLPARAGGWRAERHQNKREKSGGNYPLGCTY